MTLTYQSAFHICVVVDLWQSPSEWHLLLPACVLVCCCKTVGTWIRVTICQDLLERQDDILGHVIIGDETWVYQYDPETKRQSAQWKTANSPWPKKFHQSKSRIKPMLLTFFDIRRIFIMNLYQLDKQSTKFTIWKYWKGCERKLDRNDPNFLSTTHGSCITTMHLLTWHCLWGSF